MSDLHRQIVIETFGSEDDAIRAIQGLKAAGFGTSDISIAGRDHEDARRIADLTDVADTTEWPAGGHGDVTTDRFRIVVRAKDNAALVRRIMVEGVVDATGHVREFEGESYLSSSIELDERMATSTGSTGGLFPGTPGQCTPLADMPDEEDGFSR